MKKYIILPLFLVFILSCGGTPKVTDITGVQWKLVEVQVKDEPFGVNIIFDRKALTKEQAGDIFTLNLDKENVSGKGAPNSYSAPYTREDENISISPMRTTMIASLWQPEKLREHQYFVYMQNAYKWNLSDDKNLELFSKNEEGKEVKLVFSL